MKIRNRLSLFIFIISALSSLIAGGIIVYNATYYLEESSSDSLKALERSFSFIFSDYIDHNRSLADHTVKNSDISDFLGGRHSIMTFVSKRAAEDELREFIEGNRTIANAYIESKGSVVLGERSLSSNILDLENYIKTEFESLAYYRFKTPIGEDKEHYLVTFVDLNYLIKERFNKIRIDENTHFFIFHIPSKQFLLHTERSILNLSEEEIEGKKELINELSGEGFKSYNLNGIKRIAYLEVDGDIVFGSSIPYSIFKFSTKSLIQLFIATAAILTSIIVVVSFFASHYVIKPLREMAVYVKDISENRYDRKIPIRTRDEIGVVSQAINSMAGEIQNYTENLESLILDRTVRLQEAMVKLEKISVTDDLTGLYNRRFFDENLNRELARTNRSQAIFSIIFFDLDDFKKVNDTFGHKVGDRVLLTTGDTIRSTIREADISARWGGEEFIILLNNTNINGAFKLAETLRVKLSKVNHPDAGVVTGSFGCTQWKEGDTPLSIMNRCDKALYSSKDVGKNYTTII